VKKRKKPLKRKAERRKKDAVLKQKKRAGVPFKVVPQQGRLLIEVIAAGEDPDLFERVGLLTDEVKQVKKRQHDKKVKDK